MLHFNYFYELLRWDREDQAGIDTKPRSIEARAKEDITYRPNGSSKPLADRSKHL